jgi:hypothetical protein
MEFCLWVSLVIRVSSDTNLFVEDYSVTNYLSDLYLISELSQLNSVPFRANEVTKDFVSSSVVFCHERIKPQPCLSITP